MSAVPLSAVSSPRRILIVVLFPAPLGPRKAVIRPFTASKEISFKISLSPYFLHTLHIFMVSSIYQKPPFEIYVYIIFQKGSQHN